MKLYAFKHKTTGILAGLYALSHEIYLVDGDSDNCPTFVGHSMDEMESILNDMHEYIINDIDQSDYEIVMFYLNPNPMILK